ncbi:MAG: 3-deoxy-D-manno-octulosonic acid transferase, partial [Owenweeksia sp.]
EAEQGLPIMQEAKKTHPDHFLLLTFFSPSGYEHFAGNPAVDAVFYLPLDTPKQADDFVSILRPEAVVFIKYEIWLNYFRALEKNKIPTILAPAIFRPGQFYFKKPFRSVFLPVLKRLHRIMVQNESSLVLLQKEGFTNVEVCGDTRVDRVLELTETPFEDELVSAFCKGHTVLIVGSSWPEEEEMLRSILPHFPHLRVILAPHDIGVDHLQGISSTFGSDNCEWYTSGNLLDNRQVLVVDTIGKLSRLYRFADMAFIGGGFGKGVHSTIEAAAYGIPVLFGPNHHSFVEPGDMIRNGFGFEVGSPDELRRILHELVTQPQKLKDLSDRAQQFIRSRSGAVHNIFSVLDKIIRKD